MKKKILTVLLSMTTAICSLVGCGSDSMGNNEKILDDTYSIVCTTFPLYDWTRNIIDDEEGYNIAYIENSGTDLHNFEPSAEDVATIKDSDLFIYVGGESDGWAESLIEEDTSINALNLIDALGDNVQIETTLEGMESETEESDETEIDEHIWLSLKNTILATNAIADALPELSESMTDNLNSYINELNELHSTANDALKTDSNSFVMLFGDRFPFLYFTTDYNITPYAAFSGCSAETEASFETITFLAEKIKEYNLSRIYVLENSDQKIADRIKEASGVDVEIVVLNSMQSVTVEDVNDGITYIGLMRENIEAIADDSTL